MSGPVGRFIVASGVPGLQELSTGIATTAVARTRGVAWSALGLAGLAVLVVTVVDDARRRQERRLEAALGLHPLQVGGLRVLEVATARGPRRGPRPRPRLGGGHRVGARRPDHPGRAGRGRAGRGDRGRGGPAAGRRGLGACRPGSTGRLTVTSGLVAAPGAGRRAAVAGGPAGRRGRHGDRGPHRDGRRRRAGGGGPAARGRQHRGGPGRRCSRPCCAAASRAGPGHRPAGAGRHGDTASPLSPRRAGGVLALRRLAAPGDGQDAVVVLLSAGLAMAGFVALADRSLASSVESKSAVLAGAATAVELPDGEVTVLDPDAPAPPRRRRSSSPTTRRGGRSTWTSTRPGTPRCRTGTRSCGSTAPTWTAASRSRCTCWTRRPRPTCSTSARAAARSSRRARRSTDLAEVAAARGPRAGEDPLPPVLVVGERRGISVGDVVEARGTVSLIRLEVVGAAPLFPGQGAFRSMLVADTDTYLGALHLDDPRYVPDGTAVPDHAAGRVLVLPARRGRGRPPPRSRGARRGGPDRGDRRLQPGFVAAELVQDYQLAVAALLVVVAVVGLSRARGPQRRRGPAGRGRAAAHPAGPGRGPAGPRPRAGRRRGRRRRGRAPGPRPAGPADPCPGRPRTGAGPRARRRRVAAGARGRSWSLVTALVPFAAGGRGHPAAAARHREEVVLRDDR